MESMVKILGAFIDTLVLNVYPTDHAFEIEERRVDSLLQEELKLLKEQAQEIEEDFPTRFAFNGASYRFAFRGTNSIWAVSPCCTSLEICLSERELVSLLMRAKGGDGFNWIMHNHWLTVAVNRSSKAQILAQVRCSSAYLWRKRDLSHTNSRSERQISNEVQQGEMPRWNLYHGTQIGIRSLLMSISFSSPSLGSILCRMSPVVI